MPGKSVELLPVVGSAYDTGVPAQNQQRLINWYIEPDATGGQSQAFLKPTPGLTSFGTVSDAATIRLLFEYRNILYCIADHEFYSIDSAGTATKKGDLNLSALPTIYPARYAAYGNQILLVDSTKAYVYDLVTDTVSQISDPDFPSSVSDCTVHDGYFIVTESDSDNFYISTNTDATSWNALDVASTNTRGDYVQACVSDYRFIMFLGEKTTEIWYNSGNADFPFERQSGGMLPLGIESRETLVQTPSGIFWLSRDSFGRNQVVQSSGSSVSPITTPAIASKINSYTTTDDAIAYGHREGVHQFYVLTFPTEKVTWVYDIAVGQWHERQSFLDNEYTRHIGNTHAFAYGKSIIGDFQSNNLYYYDTSVYTENGAVLRRRRVTAPFTAANKFTSIYNLELDFEPGVGLASGQGSDPQVMLRVSKDGGHTYGNELWRSIGAQGVYNQRVKWDSLGMARDWQFDIQITDPVNAVLIGATCDMEIE